jgi:hypothetical protein
MSLFVCIEIQEEFKDEVNKHQKKRYEKMMDVKGIL